MFRFIVLCLGTVVRLLRARLSLLLENLALCQQLDVLKPVFKKCDMKHSLGAGTLDLSFVYNRGQVIIPERARKLSTWMYNTHPPS
jgi:hypothetical protein